MGAGEWGGLGSKLLQIDSFRLGGASRNKNSCVNAGIFTIFYLLEVKPAKSCTFASISQIPPVRKRKYCSFAEFSTLKPSHSPVHNRDILPAHIARTLPVIPRVLSPRIHVQKTILYIQEME
ncbi:hypothetical protein PDENDC454_09675 [Paenibacillus dendritiformis C454]|uniref:Uncharacterized protein n=1 Tax=Paenibacillus dendritiformis C454 TaxID=1131935 RepID=H3SEI4_9BACL|nr:hypothetical protein PDENDC454_09675 [Paenibacillus dendritiformis C454]